MLPKKKTPLNTFHNHQY